MSSAFDSRPLVADLLLVMLFAALVFFVIHKVSFQSRWLFGILAAAFFFLLGILLGYRHNELSNPDHYRKYLGKQMLSSSQIKEFQSQRNSALRSV